MPNRESPDIIIYDDRDWVAHRISRYTGLRRYGSIHVRGMSARDRFKECIPESFHGELKAIDPNTNLEIPASALPTLERDSRVLVISARGIATEPEVLKQVMMRLSYTDEITVDRSRNPLFVYFPKGEMLRDRWEDFRQAPFHALHDLGDEAVNLSGDPLLLDIGDLKNLLKYIAGSTAARAFNAVSFDELIYRKRSSDINKMRAEHDFYSLIPTSMRPWMVGAFDFKEDASGAEYSMLRYHFADAAFQWVHNAWSPGEYSEFLSRILYFMQARPSKDLPGDQIDDAARDLFITKVESRWHALRGDPRGAALIDSLKHSPGGKRVLQAYDEYGDLIRRHWKGFLSGSLVIGHGDPCLSNILYDPATSTLKLIDPKGASTEEALWMHPLYDYCKLSHSILGDYDFINNHLFDICVDEGVRHNLALRREAPIAFKKEFEDRVSAIVDLRTLRLAEASLFLSMLPLHLDSPRKVIAFLLRARAILDDLKAGGA